MLTPTQLAEFAETGIVRLPGAVSRADASLMCDRLWQELAARHGMRREDPATWRSGLVSGLQQISRSDAFAPARSDTVQEAARRLLGPCAAQRVVNPLVSGPSRDPQWTLPHTGWHLDLPARGSEETPGLRVFTFLDHVEPRGGATAVVLGSQRLTGRIARDRGVDGALSSRQVRETLRRREPWIHELFSSGEPEARERRFLEEGTRVEGVALRVAELTGEPGDVVLMDLRVLHAATPNCLAHPRMVLGQVIHRASAAPGEAPHPEDREWDSTTTRSCPC